MSDWNYGDGGVANDLPPEIQALLDQWLMSQQVGMPTGMPMDGMGMPPPPPIPNGRVEYRDPYSHIPPELDGGYYEQLAMQQMLPPKLSVSKGYMPPDVGSMQAQLNLFQDLAQFGMDPFASMMMGPEAFDPMMLADVITEEEKVTPGTPAVTAGQDYLLKLATDYGTAPEGQLASLLLAKMTPEQAFQELAAAGVDVEGWKSQLSPDGKTSRYDTLMSFAQDGFTRLLGDSEGTQEQREIVRSSRPNDFVQRLLDAGYTDPRQQYTPEWVQSQAGRPSLEQMDSQYESLTADADRFTRERDRYSKANYRRGGQSGRSTPVTNEELAKRAMRSVLGDTESKVSAAVNNMEGTGLYAGRAPQGADPAELERQLREWLDRGPSVGGVLGGALGAIRPRGVGGIVEALREEAAGGERPLWKMDPTNPRDAWDLWVQAGGQRTVGTPPPPPPPAPFNDTMVPRNAHMTGPSRPRIVPPSPQEMERSRLYNEASTKASRARMAASQSGNEAWLERGRAMAVANYLQQQHGTPFMAQMNARYRGLNQRGYGG